jgi:hypothetical protein
MSFYLQPDYLAFCKGFWSQEKNRFEDGSSADVIKCCIKSCDKYLSTQNTYKNLELAKSCENACLAYPSQGLFETEVCASELGCNAYDIECMKDKKQEIISCCKTHCGKLESPDCSDCEGMYELLLKTKKHFTDTIKIPTTSMKKTESKPSISLDGPIHLILVLLLSLVVSVIVFIIIFWNYKRK